MGRPKAERVTKPNMVAAAVDLAGGVTAVAKLCGITRQTVYSWIDDWRVERLIDALKLSRVSGIPIERLAGAAFDDWEESVSEPTAPARPRAKPDSE